ncbi:MAG: hypothetical protein BA863_04070 [Desulfovibrio sp. S3730MH75]|nr:MAG: hypothetical protein BA863_04070 [Desulfovibrio sp. S3730MH75]
MGGYALEEVRGLNDETGTLVSERFNMAEILAEEQVDAAMVYLTSLSNLFATAKMPDYDIPYDFQHIVLDSDIASARPEAPTDEQLEIPNIAVPVLGTINNITVPTITIPSYDLDPPPTDSLVFNEPVYQSALQDAVKAALLDFVENGGTGLGAEVEDALWERGRARQELLNERTYNEAEEYFASRGYVIPPGALGGRLSEALAEQTRADAQLNYEISIEQARLAKAHSEFSINAAITLEGQDKEQFNNIANRALDYAKSAIQVMIDLYNAKLQGYIAEMEGAKLTVEAEKIRVDAAVAANKSVTDVYVAQTEQYKTRIQAEISIVEMVAKVYGYKIAGYEADAKVAAMELDAQIRVYQANVDQARNQTELTLKEAEIAIHAYLGALQLTADAMKAGGTISAQIAASALSAVNASASLSAGASSGYSSSSTYGHSESDSLSEMHYYDETAA